MTSNSAMSERPPTRAII